jgi:hypothetical protein
MTVEKKAGKFSLAEAFTANGCQGVARYGGFILFGNSLFNL